MSVDATDVQKIYPDSASLDVSGYLAVAQAIVTAKLQDKGLTPALLDQVTIYLAAHFAVLGIERGGQRRVRLGESDESYKTPGDFDIGFASTRFGQTAMLLDTSATLASMTANNKLPALFGVVGEAPSRYNGLPYGYFW